MNQEEGMTIKMFSGEGTEGTVKEARSTFQHHSAKRAPTADVIQRHAMRKVLRDFGKADKTRAYKSTKRNLKDKKTQ